MQRRAQMWRRFWTYVRSRLRGAISCSYWRRATRVSRAMRLQQLREAPPDGLAEEARDRKRQPLPDARGQGEPVLLRGEAGLGSGRPQQVLVEERHGARAPLLLESVRARVP